MFIDDKKYEIDLSTINNLRYVLYQCIYNRPECIETLSNIINNKISCLSVEYDPSKHTFIVKIKKTAMRRLHKFRHITDYYYQIIPDIFKEFINIYRNDISAGCRNCCIDSDSMIEYISNNEIILVNLCFISCISDNIIIINI